MPTLPTRAVTAIAAVLGVIMASTGAATPVRAHDQDPHRWSAALRQARALVAQMTLDEKIGLVHGDRWDPARSEYAGHIPGVPRLGIPELYLADGPNGVGSNSNGVTAFPAAIAAASTWDTALLRRFGEAMAVEHIGKGHNVALTPTINILRIPEWGRTSESFSEDPYLTAQLAVAQVKGVQSKHVIATPKHYAANNQETGRWGRVPNGPNIDAIVSDRAQREIYFPAFEATVKQGDAASVMCAYNSVNGSLACENGDLLTATLKQAWRFSGFVMSDWYYGVKDTVRAANAGMDMEMPVGVLYAGALKEAVQSGRVPAERLDDMVRRIVAAMIHVGLLRHPIGSPADDVRTPAHRQLATELAERGTVLLKNDRGVLPLDRSVRSLAVIGHAADAGAHFVGFGSGIVRVTDGVTPLAGITARAGTGVNVTYAKGTLGVVLLPEVPAAVLRPANGNGAGLTATFYPTNDWTGAPVATQVGVPTFTKKPVAALPDRGWSARWTGTLTPTTSGLYRFSTHGVGQMRVNVAGRQLVDMPYADIGSVSHATITLSAGQPVPITVEYAAVTPFGDPAMGLGWQPADTTLLDAAVRAARTSDVAVVVADDFSGEGTDRTSLSLPGDQDQLIEAVAAANPRTIVVLNTGGPVLMPWLDRVAGVFEAWYPGQQYGQALAALLFGDANPSGRLPMTFPANSQQGPGRTTATFPGDGTTVRYDEGILVGYRWYDATGQQPLFAFGHGLSYTSFRYDEPKVRAVGNRVTVRVRVTNTGSRAGNEVAQLYASNPTEATGPPKELVGFQNVRLEPGRSTTLTFVLNPRSFAYWNTSEQRWQVERGRYRLMVGGSSADLRQSATVRLPGGTA